mmetsp:Transcript_85665/g.154222  ORF Transcript_85665/g.154222 Transcript_85665/m.154222 type:complete len:329 (-) Transcript_85665:151-1137(-)
MLDFCLAHPWSVLRELALKECRSCETFDPQRVKAPVAWLNALRGDQLEDTADKKHNGGKDLYKLILRCSRQLRQHATTSGGKKVGQSVIHELFVIEFYQGPSQCGQHGQPPVLELRLSIVHESWYVLAQPKGVEAVISRNVRRESAVPRPWQEQKAGEPLNVSKARATRCNGLQPEWVSRILLIDLRTHKALLKLSEALFLSVRWSAPSSRPQSPCRGAASARSSEHQGAKSPNGARGQGEDRTGSTCVAGLSDPALSRSGLGTGSFYRRRRQGWDASCRQRCRDSPHHECTELLDNKMRIVTINLNRDCTSLWDGSASAGFGDCRSD